MFPFYIVTSNLNSLLLYYVGIAFFLFFFLQLLMYPLWWHHQISWPLSGMGERTFIIHCPVNLHCLPLLCTGFCNAVARSNSKFSIVPINRAHKCMYFSISHATKRQEFICALLKASPLWGISVGGNKVSVCTAWHSPQCRNGCICDKYTG